MTKSEPVPKRKSNSKKRRRLIIGAVLCCLGAFFVWASPVSLGLMGAAKSPTPGSAQLVVLSYNVNYGVAGDASTVTLIAESGANVVFLQETTPRWQAAIEERTRDLFPYQYWRDPSGGYLAGGSAILSQWPLREMETSPSPVDWFEAISAIVETPFGELRVVGLHLEPAVSLPALMRVSSHHQDEIQAHIAAFGLSEALPTIIAGDFNEERAGALRALGGIGFVDAIDVYAPGDATFDWSVGPFPLGLQIDHVLHRGLETMSAEVLEGGRSDHRAVRANFRFP